MTARSGMFTLKPQRTLCFAPREAAVTGGNVKLLGASGPLLAAANRQCPLEP